MPLGCQTVRQSRLTRRSGSSQIDWRLRWLCPLAPGLRWPRKSGAVIPPRRPLPSIEQPRCQTRTMGTAKIPMVPRFQGLVGLLSPSASSATATPRATTPRMMSRVESPSTALSPDTGAKARPRSATADWARAGETAREAAASAAPTRLNFAMWTTFLKILSVYTDSGSKDQSAFSRKQALAGTDRLLCRLIS